MSADSDDPDRNAPVHDKPAGDTPRPGAHPKRHQQRVAAAMRDNLLKRKALSRARSSK